MIVSLQFEVCGLLASASARKVGQTRTRRRQILSFCEDFAVHIVSATEESRNSLAAAVRKKEGRYDTCWTLEEEVPFSKTSIKPHLRYHCRLKPVRADVSRTRVIDLGQCSPSPVNSILVASMKQLVPGFQLIVPNFGNLHKHSGIFRCQLQVERTSNTPPKQLLRYRYVSRSLIPPFIGRLALRHALLNPSSCRHMHPDLSTNT